MVAQNVTDQHMVDIALLKRWQSDTNQNMNDFFLIVISLVIYFMQCGFALLECGSVRSKNATNILIKNLLDSFVAGLSFWLVGYAFSQGDGNSFIGYSQFAHHGLSYDSYSYWFFHFVFAATAATIVSGAVAERCDFWGYFIYSFFLTGWIYPVVAHWAWHSQGWMNRGGTYYKDDGTEFYVGYKDFAGSGVVHAVGGLTAFIGAAFLGPRIGKFDYETGEPIDLKGHSVPVAATGGFILLFGFFAFNGGSQGSISSAGDGAAVSTSIVATVLGGTGGGFITLLLNKSGKFGDGKWSLLTTLNGCLTGMAAVCTGCDGYDAWAGFVVGIIGGISYLSFSWLVIHLKVDDPLDATALHFGGGVVGVICAGFFHKGYGLFYHQDRRAGLQLGWQFLGLSAILGWTALNSGVMWFCIKMTGLLRVDPEFERKGLDVPKHGEPAYPAEAYGHGWGEKGDTLGSMMSYTVTNKSQDAKDMQMRRRAGKAQEHPELDAMANKNTNI